MSENEKAVKQPKPHRFKQGINVVQPISSVGDIAYQSAKREIEDSDEDFRGGLQEVKKYGMPAMDALAIAGAKELSKSIKVEFKQGFKGAGGDRSDISKTQWQGKGKLYICDGLYGYLP